MCRSTWYVSTHLYFEGKHVLLVVAPADSLDARGHVEGSFPHVRPIAHHARLPNYVAVRVPPGFIEGVSAEGRERGEGGNIGASVDGLNVASCTLTKTGVRVNVVNHNVQVRCGVIRSRALA